MSIMFSVTAVGTYNYHSALISHINIWRDDSNGVRKFEGSD